MSNRKDRSHLQRSRSAARSELITQDFNDADAAIETSNTPRKRKRKVIDLTGGETSPTQLAKNSQSLRKGSKKAETEEDAAEKRLRRFRPHAPSSFRIIQERATTQRMIVLDRERIGTPEQPGEAVKIAGTTGNVYTVHITLIPSCDCPYAQKGHQCKHIVYVLANTLKAPEHLQYQLALLTSELVEIFDGAPTIPSQKGASDQQTNTPGNQKTIEGDCPICCIEFDPDNEEITYCKAACGNNVHLACFQQWAASKRSSGSKVTCPFCRTPWQADEVTIGKLANLKGAVGADGYVNVADQLGLSGVRDYSSYHQHWVRSQRRRGLIEDNWFEDE